MKIMSQLELAKSQNQLSACIRMQTKECQPATVLSTSEAPALVAPSMLTKKISGRPCRQSPHPHYEGIPVCV